MSEFNLRSNWTPLVLILIIISIISSIGFIATYFSLLSLISELENTEDSRIRAIEQLNVAIGVSNEANRITALLEDELKKIELELTQAIQNHEQTKEELEITITSLQENNLEADKLLLEIEILTKKLEELEFEPKPSLINTPMIFPDDESPPIEEDNQEDDEKQKIIKQIEKLKSQLSSCTVASLRFTLDFMLNNTLSTLEKNADVETANQSIRDVLKAFEISCR